ncbi:MAG: threonine ammonia-lyase [Bradymonadaceae bacterium]|nr:threonine ammonia-lyase [Lujinxingiaceae bacterium]
MVTFAEIEQARERIRNAVVISPCSPSALLSKRLGCKVFLKLENLQLTGSFKERGACNKIRQLSEEEKARGIIAASAGNHAQAVAYHAAQLGISAKIVMPEGTPLLKITRTRGFGGDVVLWGSSYDEAYAKAVEVMHEEGRVFVHPFDDRAVIAGQGTLGLELLEQNPYLDCVVVPVGGGGLAAGVAVALKETNPKIRVIGVEAEALASMKLSIAGGSVVEVPEATTICDGIAVRRVGELSFATLRHYVDDIVTVSEEEVANAILDLLEQDKTVAEGAGAAAVAALIGRRIGGVDGKKVCAVVSGGNIDVNVIARIIERGLVAAGRIYRIDLQLRDTPGSLARVLTLIATSRANVLEIYHNRTFAEGSPLGLTNVELKLETRGEQHIEQLRAMLEDEGYRILDRL